MFLQKRVYFLPSGCTHNQNFDFVFQIITVAEQRNEKKIEEVIVEAYLGVSETFVMELFCKSGERKLLAVHYFCKNAP